MPKIASYYLVDKNTLRVLSGPLSSREEARSLKRNSEQGNLMKIAQTVFGGFVR